jgi:hypothetical protein
MKLQKQTDDYRKRYGISSNDCANPMEEFERKLKEKYGR